VRGLSYVQGENKMLEQGIRNPEFGANKFGFRDLQALNWNFLEPELYECAIISGEAKLTSGGASAPRPAYTRVAAPRTNISSATTSQTRLYGGETAAR
jgi:hypothetical protein